MRTFVFSFLLFSGFAAQSQDCAPVDHSARFGPVRDQGESGWCYAFAGADLIGERLGVKPPDMVSAFDLAAGYYATDLKDARKNIAALDFSGLSDGKRARTALTKIVTQIDDENQAYAGRSLADREGGDFFGPVATYNVLGGYCLESQLPSQDPNDTSSRDYVYRQIERLETTATVSKTALCDEGRGSPGNLKALAEVVNASAFTEVRRSIDERCKPRHSMNPVVSNALPTETPRDKTLGMKRLDELLGSGDKGQSAGIGYDSCRIVAKSDARKVQGERCDHVSVVVGRRKNPKTGACEYKVRNSWGTDCSGYDKRMVASCEGGYYWIEHSRLKSVLFEVAWVK
ncbi:MAG: hypothetical protein KF799_06665 [Bdellovibrionales bacterium]|nr:hypothetical protein [Bdellovibrionales bacterium]